MTFFSILGIWLLIGLTSTILVMKGDKELQEEEAEQPTWVVFFFRGVMAFVWPILIFASIYDFFITPEKNKGSKL